MQIDLDDAAVDLELQATFNGKWQKKKITPRVDGAQNTVISRL
jgi:hypothetical protein